MMDLESYLKKTPTTKGQRAELWDAFESSANADEFAKRVEGMSVPKPVKARLWDMKAGKMSENPDVKMSDSPDVSAIRAANSKYTVNPDESSPVMRFGKGLLSALNPVAMAEGLGDAAGRGLAAIDREGLPGALASGGRAMVDAQSRGFVNAWDLAGEGRTTEALGQALSGAVPIVGPMARNLGEEAAETGDLAGAFGKGVGLGVTPRALSKAPAGIRLLDGKIIKPITKGLKRNVSLGAEIAKEVAKEWVPGVKQYQNVMAKARAAESAVKKAESAPAPPVSDELAAAKQSRKVDDIAERAEIRRQVTMAKMDRAKEAKAAKTAEAQAKKDAGKAKFEAAKADKPPTVTVPGETGPKVVSEGAMFDATTGKPVKLTPEQAKAAVDELPWNKAKADKTPAQAKFDKAKSDRLMKQVDEAISPNAAYEILKKHGIEGKKIPDSDARAIVDAVWTKKDSTYQSIEQWMDARKEKWNKMRHKKGTP